MRTTFIEVLLHVVVELLRFHACRGLRISKTLAVVKPETVTQRLARV